MKNDQKRHLGGSDFNQTKNLNDHLQLYSWILKSMFFPLGMDKWIAISIHIIQEN